MPESAIIEEGDSIQYRAFGAFGNESEQDVTDLVDEWRSSIPRAVRIDGGGRATAEQNGRVFITARIRDLEATADLRVIDVTNLVIEPMSATIVVGGTQQFSARAIFNGNSQSIDVTSSTSWSSSPESIATVNADGLATGGESPGTVQIIAIAGDQRSEATLIVELPPPLTVDLSIDPMTATIVVGEGQQFRVQATLSDGSTQDVTSQATWTSSNTSVATVDAMGLATGVRADDMVVLITAQFEGLSANASLTVQEPIVVPVTLAIDPMTATIVVGERQQFRVQATLSDGSTQDVTSQATWTSSNTSVATVDAMGLATGVRADDMVVLITAQFEGLSANASLTVQEPIVVPVTLAIDPMTATIVVGERQQFRVQATLSDGSTQDVTSQATWTSSNTSVATVDAMGLATGVRADDMVVLITAQFEGLSANASLTVQEPIVVPVTLAIDPMTATIVVGEGQQFRVQATLSDGSTQDVTSQATWTSSNTSVATVDAMGLATGVRADDMVVLITAQFEGLSANASLTVQEPIVVPVTLAIDPMTATIVVGERQQFRVQATLSDGSTQDVTSQATWTSSNTSVATVDAMGLATGVRADDMVVLITAQFEGLSANASLTVQEPIVVPVTLAIDPMTATIVVGEGQQFRVQATLSDGSTQDVTSQATWTSSNTSVATVDAMGLATGVRADDMVVLITAQFEGLSANASLTVQEPIVVPVTLAIDPMTATIVVGERQQFRVQATLSDGSTQDVTSQATWTSSNTSVATVDAMGLATGVRADDMVVLITAQFEGLSANASLTVQEPIVVPVTLAIDPMTATIVVGEGQQFRVQATLSDGSTQDVTSQATWTSSNTSVATVDAMGLATGVRADDMVVLITAQFEGLSANASLTVQEPIVVPVTLAIDPMTATIVVGEGQQFRVQATLSDGSTQDVTSQATWTSSNTSVATVDAMGLATGVRADDMVVLITAQFEGLSANASLTVQEPEPALVANAGADQTVFVKQEVTLDGSASRPDDIFFTWEIIERPEGSNATLSDPTDNMPAFTADQPGEYHVELIVFNDLAEMSEPDRVVITAIVPAVIAQGVGLQDRREGRITIALPGAPIQAFLSWQIKDGVQDPYFEFYNGVEGISSQNLEVIESIDSGVDDIRCFYADITDYILANTELVTYTVTYNQPIPGAGIIVIASDLEASVEKLEPSGSGTPLHTVSRITLGAETDPRRRVIQIKAGCDFFFHEASEPVIFEFEPSPSDRAAKVTLLVGDAQSNDTPRRSEIKFASPAGASPISLTQGDTALVANDGCHWDTFGRNSGVQPPVQVCDGDLFPSVDDPDRRGVETVPSNTASVSVQLNSPMPDTSTDLRGVSATLSLAVLELIARLDL